MGARPGFSDPAAAVNNSLEEGKITSQCLKFQLNTQNYHSSVF